MFVPRKLQHKVNYYHTMWCVEISIMYRWYLVEGGDLPKELGNPEYQTISGKSIISLMWIMKNPLCWSVNTVITGSGLFLFRDLVGMFFIVVRVSALAKERRYWPILISGEGTNTNSDTKKLAWLTLSKLEGFRILFGCCKRGQLKYYNYVNILWDHGPSRSKV